MARLITMKEFLKNPVSSGSASVARRDQIRFNMEHRFNVLYRAAKGQFEAKIYPIKDNVYFHIKVPSEEFYPEKLRYDVVIRFIPPNKDSKELGLDKYYMNVFSNAMNFSFTYAYVFNKLGLMIPWLKPKLPKRVFTDAPVIRNPEEALGFEKSIYFALLYLQLNHNKLFKDKNIKKNIFSKEDLFNSIPSMNAKKKDYDAKRKQFKAHKKVKIDRTVAELRTGVVTAFKGNEKVIPKDKVTVSKKAKERIYGTNKKRKTASKSTKGLTTKSRKTKSSTTRKTKANTSRSSTTRNKK
jgi:hypothetical protein